VWDGLALNASGSAISDNTSGGGGGGLYVAPMAVAHVLDCTFQGNQAVEGGGIDNNAVAVFIGSTVTGNTATRKGGGIANHGRLALIATTVTDNSPDDISGRAIKAKIQRRSRV
jgi:hypothetical protein